MSKPVRKTREELLKLDQANRLKKFRIEKKINSKKALAEKLGISITTINDIENYRREISDNLAALLILNFPDLDIDLLKDGVQKKLLTINKGENQLNEPRLSYLSCPECIKKEHELNELNGKYRKLLEDYSDCLKQLAGIKKASSE